MKSVGIIGGGFSGLAAACYSASRGESVTLIEKNHDTGGRGRVFSEKGFTYDMGPSWYWMPDIIERFFNDFGKSTSDYYKLVKLDPAFQIFFKDQDPLIVPGELNDLYDVFESREKGSAKKLKEFLDEAGKKYNLAVDELIYKPGFSWSEYISPKVLSGVMKYSVASPMSKHVRKYFKNPALISLMEFPVIFLGAMPDRIPALYSLMNFAAFNMGTWYPMGGMGELPKAMTSLAQQLGVNFLKGTEVTGLSSQSGLLTEVVTTNGAFKFDSVISSADYHHTENELLTENTRNYSEAYWDKRVMAPSCLIFYLGVNKQINKLQHHNLFFDTDFDKHASEIYITPKWPDDPLFYVCCPSKTDPTVAPEGCENLFVLIPLATDLEDSQEKRDIYYGKIMKRMETICGESIESNIIYRKDYCLKDFKKDYNAFKGNAYGLANTLSQTAVLKPSVRNKKIRNLFYTGQLTVPGPGLPPALISGKIAATEVYNYLYKD